MQFNYLAGFENSQIQTHTESESHRKKVKQVGVGVYVGRHGLDQCQLMQYRVELLGLRQINTRFLIISPIRQSHMHRDQILQMNPQDREPET